MITPRTFRLMFSSKCAHRRQITPSAYIPGSSVFCSGELVLILNDQRSTQKGHTRTSLDVNGPEPITTLTSQTSRCNGVRRVSSHVRGFIQIRHQPSTTAIGTSSSFYCGTVRERKEAPRHFVRATTKSITMENALYESSFNHADCITAIHHK